MTQAWIDGIGFMAGGMTVAAFYCRRMLSLRVAAVMANVLFIVYGAAMQLNPVLYLHCVLLPLNLMRLVSAWQARRAETAAARKADARAKGPEVTG